METSRRSLIKGIGAALCAGLVPSFVPSLVGGSGEVEHFTNTTGSDILVPIQELTLNNYLKIVHKGIYINDNLDWDMVVKKAQQPPTKELSFMLRSSHES